MTIRASMPRATALVLTVVVPAVMAASLRSAGEQQGAKINQMTSAKVPRRKFSTDSGDDSWDDVSRPEPEVQQQRYLYDYNYTPMGKDDETPVEESYEYVGCFKHDWEKSSLEYAFHSRKMTTDSCYKHCYEMEATHMALEFGFVCVCGWEPEEEYTEPEVGTCDTGCSGDKGTMCGGYYAYDLFRLGTPSDITSDDGCDDYWDSEDEEMTMPPVDPSGNDDENPMPMPPTDGDLPDGDDMLELLRLHNMARCQHDAKALSYSTEVEKHAVVHAEFLASDDMCGKLEHSSGSGFGENLFMCSSSDMSYECYKPAYAMENLYEKELNDGETDTWGGHATQILWKGTTELGCAVATCDKNDNHHNILVCNYNPPGNYGGEYEKEVGKKSKSEGECDMGFPTGPSDSDDPMPTSDPTGAPDGSPEEETYSPSAAPSPAPEEEEEKTTAPSAEPTPAPEEEEEKTTAPSAAPSAEPASPGEGLCAKNPCENGGSCSLDSEGGYMCTCTPGYAGMKCKTNTEGLPKWSIVMEYPEGMSSEHQAVFEDAARKWETIIPFAPGGGAPNQAAGVLVITAVFKDIDGPGGILGSAGPTGVWQDHPGISYSGMMEFDSADMQSMEDNGSFKGVILHEMGHVIGVGTLWDKCSTCNRDGSPVWTCDSAAEAYNDMMGGDADIAEIVELEGSTGTKCGHFSEKTFDNELMTGFVNAGEMPLSKLTCASLEDIGYVVECDKVDGYTIPANRPPSAKISTPNTFEVTSKLESWPIEQKASDGSTTTMQGSRMRF